MKMICRLLVIISFYNKDSFLFLTFKVVKTLYYTSIPPILGNDSIIVLFTVHTPFMKRN